MNKTSTGSHYDTTAKGSYRTEVYDYLVRLRWHCSPHYHDKMDHVRVALLDTAQGLETVHALRRGLKPENVYVANRDVRRGSAAAWKAVFTRSLKAAGYENRCHVHPGEDLLGMCSRAGGPFDMINYDSCATVGTAKWLCYVARLKSLVAVGGIFAVTVLAARESQRVKRFMLESGDQHERDRIESASSFCDNRTGVIEGWHLARYRLIQAAVNAGRVNRINVRDEPRCKVYVNAKSPMMSAAFKMSAWRGWDSTRPLAALVGHLIDRNDDVTDEQLLTAVQSMQHDIDMERRAAAELMSGVLSHG